MQYSNEIVTRWRNGEVEELSNILGDRKDIPNGTFFEWIDVGVGYDYPSFVCGDEDVFDEYHQELKEIGQNR